MNYVLYRGAWCEALQIGQVDIPGMGNDMM